MFLRKKIRFCLSDPSHYKEFLVCLSMPYTLMERKLRMPQIQGVQGRMPYAAAKQQPSTCEPLACSCLNKSRRLGILGFPQRWRIPTIGRDSPKEKAYWLFLVNQNREKNRNLITHHYCEYTILNSNYYFLDQHYAFIVKYNCP